MRVKFHEYFQHLEDSAEKNRQVSTVSNPVSNQDNKLPSPRTEAKALFRMVGRNGDNLESMRALIQVEDEVKRLMFRHATDKEEVKRMLRFRGRVLAVFDELALKQEKKRLRRHSRIRFPSKRQGFHGQSEGESERLYGTSTES